MSRRRRGKNNNRTRQPQPSKLPALSLDETSTLDPDKLTIPDLYKLTPVKVWVWLASVYIGSVIAAFSVGALFGQTDLAMDHLGNRTRLNLETERASHSETKRELGITKNSLAKAQTEADQLQQELVETRKKHEILELFGSDFWLYRVYDLQEIGATIELGTCGKVSCYKLVLEGFGKGGVPEEVVFRLSGPGTTLMGEGYALPLYMRLEKGCGIEFYSGKYRFLLRIEDDRITSLRAGLSIRTTDKEKPQRGVKIAQNTCNFSNVK